MRKDISLNLNLKSPAQYEQNLPNVIPVSGNVELTKNVITNESSNTSKRVLPHTGKTQQSKLNRTNTSQFPNIAFVLNPTYAKRNNVNPTIVSTEECMICTDYSKAFFISSRNRNEKIWHSSKHYTCTRITRK